MRVAKMAEKFEHQINNNRFVCLINGSEAELTYQKNGNQNYIFNHTFVPSSLRGMGVASKLSSFAFDEAQKSGWKVVPTCSYLTDTFLPKTGGKYDDILL
ncbi:hypothetical protein AKO1_010191 [Acrasis kona]|uniref:N-acetyltransferase domain-containing protein n=1 Tax=Acrasis kona TaxID=1008807 RepID=A0AAW2ZQN1_9EUKA